MHSEDIKVVNKDRHLGGTTYTHPSYGMISVSRYTGGSKEPKFGSEIPGDGGIRLAIEEADVTQKLGCALYC